MNDSPHRTEQSEDVPTYRGILYEALVDAVRDLVDGTRRAVSITVGNQPTRDARCQMKGCEGSSVSTLDHPDQWKDELEVCRKHWLIINGATKGVLAVLVLASIALSLILVMYA